jgi:D-beta-D-heptose 7-phosphate kinase/D-beta-D-heptose 1-phosphate adenosyltransferase
MDVVVVGDAMLDRDVIGSVERFCPEAPVPVLAETGMRDRPGGAGLAAALAAGEHGVRVTLVTALGADAAGDRVRQLLDRVGVRLVELPYRGPSPQKIRMRAGGHLLMRLDRGDGGGVLGEPTAEVRPALEAAAAILVSDYGRGVAALPPLRDLLAARAEDVPVVWDPHPKGAPPVPGARLATPNESEARQFANGNGVGVGPGACASLLRQVWSVGAVAVTRDSRGAVLADGVGGPTSVPAPFAVDGDSCGAGDRFASAAALALGGGSAVLDAVRAAVTAASAYVALRGVHLPAELSILEEGA